MKKISLKTVFPLCSLILAAVFFYLGVAKFGFWDEVKGPMGGFYPALISAVLFFISALAFFQSFREKLPVIHKKDLLVLLAAVLILAGSYVFGMIGAIFLYLIIWMKAVEKAGWKQTILMAVCVGGAAWMIFGVWLGIHFPKGILLEKLF